MMQLIRIELYKIFRRPRTYISFAIIAAIALLIELAMYADGETFISFVTQNATEGFTLGGKLINGYLITFIILQMLLVHIPLLVALVAADAVAGEASLGTLRLLLSKPISRSQLILSKYAASIIYSLALLLWLAVIGLASSLFLFGPGDLINLKSDTVIILLANDVLWRYCAAFAFAALAMTTVSALALLLSVLADNAIGPIIGTMGIIIVLTIITNLDLPVFNAIKPAMLTSHLLAWKGFLSEPVPARAIAHSCLILTAYAGGFTGLAIILFNRKDIQS
ncbi:MAG: ABC transporter permease subunit [Chitinophagaceae bacterium]